MELCCGVNQSLVWRDPPIDGAGFNVSTIKIDWSGILDLLGKSIGTVIPESSICKKFANTVKCEVFLGKIISARVKLEKYQKS